MRLFVATIFVAVALGAGAQVVFVGGPPDADYCLKLHVKPNLEASWTIEVRGRITDESGAPFKNSTVELRRYVSETKQLSLKTVKTDADGNFEFPVVPKGRYRLLASPTRAFQQPEELKCGSGDRCFLSIKLKVNPTDMPESICPVR